VSVVTETGALPWRVRWRHPCDRAGGPGRGRGKGKPACMSGRAGARPRVVRTAQAGAAIPKLCGPCPLTAHSPSDTACPLASAAGGRGCRRSAGESRAAVTLRQDQRRSLADPAIAPARRLDHRLRQVARIHPASQAFRDAFECRSGVDQRSAQGPSWISLFVKQVCMAPSPGKLSFIAVDTVDQQPIGLDMKVPKPFPCSRQRMIAIRSGKRLAFDRSGNDPFSSPISLPRFSARLRRF
jgi:hypothetical protein